MANTDQNTREPTRIFIATPSYDAQVHTGYALSLVKTHAYFQNSAEVDILHQFRLHDCSIPRARNYFAAFFLSDPTLTHLLFIDSDINWNPEHIGTLLKRKKPIIAATFPKKKYIWDKLREEHVQRIIMDKKLSSEEFQRRIKANLVDYAINFGDSREVKDNVIEVKHVATAFMMIERQVLEKMCREYPERKITNHNDVPPKVHQHLFSLFEQENEQGEYLSSDYSFCRLWAKTGGKVFADLSITLSHHGAEDYIGNIMDLGYPKPPSSLS